MPAVTATTDTRCSPKHLVISGSRSIADRLTGFLSPKQQAIVVQRVLADSAFDGTQLTTVLHGDNHDSPDGWAANWATYRDDVIESPYPADWDAYGRSAGPIRNDDMIDDGDALLAFWDGSSSGCGGTIDTALDAGLPVAVYYFNSEDVISTFAGDFICL